MEALSELFATIGGFALMVAFVSGIKYGGKADNVIAKKIFKVSGLVFVVMLVADIAFDISHNKNTSTSTPALAKVEQPAPAQKETTPTKPVAQPVAEFDFSLWSNFPEQISPLPSIGTTRTEFEKYHRQTDTNSPAHIRYDNDMWHVWYSDGNCDDSADKRSRAALVYMQVLPEYQFPVFEIKDLLPNDTANLQVDEKGTDNMVKYRNFTGTSEIIAAMFPKSGGNFSGSFCWDAQTNNFLGGTIKIEFAKP